MPHVINGCGTWYYGKKNILEYPATCRHCGKETTLKSYDTTEYVVIFFIPVIPLKKYRIIEDCPLCRRHGRTAMKEWEESKRKIFDEAQEKYRQNPSDPAAAAELLKACSSFQDRGAFLAMASQVAQNLSDNPETLNLMGDIADGFGCLFEAELAFQASLSCKDSPETRERLAVILVKSNRPAEALPLIQHIIDDEIPDKISYLTYLARGFQMIGDHRQALNLFDKAVAIVPQLATDKKYIKLRRLSEKNLNTGKPIKAKELGAIKVMEGSSIGSGLAKWIFPAIVIFLLGLYIVAAYSKGRSREIFLVNGLSQKYSVNVNNKNHEVFPGHPTTVAVSEGIVDVAVSNESLKIPAQKHKIQTSFWSRPFSKKKFLINPDGVAPLYWELTFYAPKEKKSAPTGASRIYIGQTFYMFDKIDYFFEPFPHEITLSSESVVGKMRLSLLNNLAYPAVVSMMEKDLGKERAIEILKKKLEYEPDDYYTMRALSVHADPKAFIELARPYLDKRPLMAEWHWHYQIVMEKSQPDYDLVAEYRNLFASDPENSELQYLLGRLLPDRAEGDALIMKSTTGAKPSVYGDYAIAYRKMSDGLFEEAVPFAKKAYETRPEAFKSIWLESLEAAGQYEPLIEEYDKIIEKNRKDFNAIKSKARILCLKDGAQAAESAASQWLLKNNFPEEANAVLSNSLKLEIAYCSGDLNKFSQLLSGDKNIYSKFMYSITNNRTMNAAEILADMEKEYKEDTEGYTLLILYLAQIRTGLREEAEKTLASALDIISSKNNFEERLIAECLQGRKTPDPLYICGLPIRPREKTILLTAMGVRFPSDKEIYFAMARKLNYDRRFPYHFINSIISPAEKK